MTKLTPLTSITSGYLSNEQIEGNFEKITTAFDNTLSRDGSAPNFMSSSLDMNGNHILNVASPTLSTDLVTLGFLNTNFGSGNIDDFSQAQITADHTTTPRSISSRFADNVHPKDFGAVCDNTTNDYAAVLATITDASTYHSPFVFDNNKIATTLVLTSNLTPGGGTCTSTSNVQGFAVTGTKITSIGTNYYNTSDDGPTIQQNHDGTDNNIYIGNRINGTSSYAFLDNDSDCDGLLLLGCDISSGQADAVAINHPTSTGANSIVSSSFLTAVNAGSSPSSGFAYSIAAELGHILIGCHIKESRQEAIHIEDNQERGIAVAVTGNNLKGDGVRLLIPSTGAYDPMIGNTLHLKHTGTKTNYTGLDIITDLSGAYKQTSFLGCSYNGFGTGINVGEVTHAFNEGSLIQNSDTGIFVAKKGRALGVVSADTCTTLATGQGGAIIDGVVSYTTPTNILTRNGSGEVGVILKRWRIPKTFTHTGSGSEDITLLAVPTRFKGNITIVIPGGSGLMLSADYLWDNSSLSQISGTEIKNVFGATTSPVLSVSGSNLVLTFLNSSNAQTQTMFIEFDGIWYKA